MSGRLAVVGYGYWGMKVIRVLVGEYDVSRIVLAECSDILREDACVHYPGLQVVADVTLVLSLEDVDSVYICTPMSTHNALVKECIRYGKNIWVEKPIATRFADVQDILSAAHSAGRVLFCDFTSSFDTRYRKLRDELHRVGNIKCIRGVRRSTTTNCAEQPETDVVQDLMIHDIFGALDILSSKDTCYLDMIPRVLSTSCFRLPDGRLSSCHVLMAFENGVHIELDASWQGSVRQRTFEVLGRDAAIGWDAQESPPCLNICRRNLAMGESPLRLAINTSEEPLALAMRAFSRLTAEHEKGIGDFEGLLRIYAATHRLAALITSSASQSPLAPPRQAYHATRGVRIIEPCNIYGCHLEEDVFVGPFVEIQRNVRIGRGTRVSSHCFVCEDVTVGADCFLGHHVVFTNDRFRTPPGEPYHQEHTDVGDSVRIGSNATILPVRIGEGAVIGAGSVVTHDVPAGAVVCGNPARIRRSMRMDSP